VREFILWYERRRGSGSLQPLLAGLSPELLALVDPHRHALGILASSWYPCALVHPMLDRVIEDRDDEGQALARDANAEVVPLMIHGIYRVFIRALATPALYAANVERMWKRLHSTGRRTMQVRSKSESFSVVDDWAGHHPVLCWTTIYTMVYLHREMGYKHVAAERIECVSHGAPRCATVLRYG
jgi:hypothetical protein